MLMQTLAVIAGEESKAVCRYEHSRSNGVMNQYGRCGCRPAGSVTVHQDVTLMEGGRGGEIAPLPKEAVYH